MRFVRVALFLVAVPASALASEVQVLELGISSSRSKLENGVHVFEVLEELEGQDLNGDGDEVDSVLHVVDTRTLACPPAQATCSAGAVVNLGIAVWHWVRDDRWVAAMVYEPDQGATDLNGNGRVEDWVLMVVDAETATVANPAIAATGIAVREGTVAFAAHEITQGADWNGDGDVDDFVLHTYDAIDGSLRNHGVAADANLPFRIHRGLLAAAVSEANQGLSDWNGDGDILDRVLVRIALPDGPLTNVGHATAAFQFAGDRHLLFAVLEDQDGGVDRNGNGEAHDPVLFFHDLVGGATWSSGLASTLAGGGGSDATAVRVHEREQSFTDFNGDGDAFDSVLHVFDPESEALVNAGIASLGRVDVSGTRVATLVHELEQGGTDLNGDGDARDNVVHLYDASSGTLTNLRLAAGVFELSGEILVVPVEEHEQGQDRNGDGDADDIVAHVLDPATTAPRNLAVTMTFAFDVDGHVVSFIVSEEREGVDLNGDGDASDFVLHLHDAFRDLTTNTGLEALRSDVEGYRAAIDILETSVDWNGDGDTLDPILHLVDYRPEAAVRLTVNGQRPESHVVTTPGPTLLELDMSRGGDERALDWYAGLVHRGVRYWVTPGGLSRTKQPFRTAAAPVDMTGRDLVSFVLPPGETIRFFFGLVEGSDVVDFDFFDVTG